MNISFVNDFSKNKDVPMSEDQILPFLNSIGKTVDKLVLSTVLFLGISDKELTGIRWSDIDFTEQNIKIFDGRLKRIRIAYGPLSFFEALQDYKKRSNIENGLVFPFTKYQFNRMLDDATKGFFGETRTWHAMRLSYLKSAAKKLTLQMVSENMGVSPSQLMKYFNTDSTKLKKALDTMISKDGGPL